MKVQRGVIITLLLIVVAAVFFGRPSRSEPVRLVVSDPVPELPVETTNSQVDAAIIPESAPKESPSTPLPDQILHQAPFTTQAPDANWDAFYEEMCEEAAMIIAWRYHLGDTNDLISKDDANRWIDEVATWERENIGTDVSTPIEAARQTLSGHFQIESSNLQVITVSGVDDLKEALQKGVVIAPFAGRMLENPNFRGEGPRYHMLTIIGYEGEQFITHDVGTRNGRHYRYDYQVILTALHDFVPENQDISTGEPVVLVVSR